MKKEFNTLPCIQFHITTNLLGNGELVITRVESFDCEFNICHFMFLLSHWTSTLFLQLYYQDEKQFYTIQILCFVTNAAEPTSLVMGC